MASRQNRRLRGPQNRHLAVGMPNVKLHRYGKGIPERGRKMGHLTALADSSEQAAEHAVAARKLLNLGVTFVFRNDNTMPQASSNVLSKSGQNA